MKNIFRFLGLALVAGSMLVACGPEGTEEETEYFTIKVSVNDKDMGTALLDNGKTSGKYEKGTVVVITPTAKSGYVFDKWEDGSTFNPRQVSVTADAEYTANFVKEVGVRVKFGDTEWKAGYVNAQLATNAIILKAAQVSATAMPQIALQYVTGTGEAATPVTTGTFTSATPAFTPITSGADSGKISVTFGNPRIWYFEQQYVAIGTTQTGDWWGKSTTLQITALDATAMTFSAIITTPMAHMTEMINNGVDMSKNINDLTSRDLTVTVNDQTMVPYSGKGMNDFVNGGILPIAK